MPLSHGDDFPLHQTPDTIGFAGTDRNFYDRYFFNGYAPDGSGFFAIAFGVYPQLDVADAHCSFIRDGKQYSLHASCELNGERMAMRVGPIAIEVVEPLHQLKVTIDEADGIAGEVIFTGRSHPIEEPRFTHRIGTRAFMDYTRMTQNGSYTGWLSLDGDKRELAKGTSGTRDRSWGIRPVGARDPQPIPGAPMPSFFWQWTPINLEGGSLFFHINADPHGNAWNTRAAWAADGASADQIIEGRGMLASGNESGTRWPDGGTIALELGDGAPQQVTLKPLSRFQMKGLGYTHPVWNHGVHHGALKVEREEFDLASLDPLQPDNLHVQILCKATALSDSGPSEGMGVFEQLIIGPYAPMRLDEFLDGAK
jgi:hypothetical protein